MRPGRREYKCIPQLRIDVRQLEATRQALTDPKDSHDTEHALVLVVERDPHVRELERFFLHEAGFAVDFAEDGLSALEMVRTGHPAIIVTEIIVPRLDGLALCRKVKEDPALASTVVLVFSILAAHGRARDARADAFLRVKQIVLNLLGNAIKFTAPGGEVRMTCDVGRDDSRGGTASGARVTVNDTGRGIPADQIEAIWKPFVQVGRTHRQPAEGVGLGLAISRDLARQMGGDISCRSEPGRGSSFMLVLPLA